MKKIFALLMVLCLNIYVAHAQELDSIRNQRMKWVEEYQSKYKEKLIFAFNEKEISMEDYLNMPEDSIEGCTFNPPEILSIPNPMFYVYGKGKRPAFAWESSYDLKETGVPFCISGGIPATFKEGADSLRNYLNAHQSVPDSLYRGALTNAYARVEVFCCIDEEGHIWNVRADKIHLMNPMVCDIDLGNSFADPIDRLTKSGLFSHEYGKWFDCIAKDAQRVVQGLPDFNPGRVYLEPTKYRLLLKIHYHKSGPIYIDHGPFH